MAIPSHNNCFIHGKNIIMMMMPMIMPMMMMKIVVCMDFDNF